MKVRYTEGPDFTDVHTAERGVVVVERGKPVDLPLVDARALIASGGTWEHVKPKKPAPKKPAPKAEAKEVSES